jgi:hypothetical protein
MTTDKTTDAGVVTLQGRAEMVRVTKELAIKTGADYRDTALDHPDRERLIRLTRVYWQAYHSAVEGLLDTILLADAREGSKP